MSKFTTEVRFICETEAGYEDSKGFNDIDEILEKSAPKIFNFYYPIFDEEYRIPLEKKILKHFYTREICEETVGLWKLRLDDRMNMIMPYANKLYESSLLEFDPFHDVDLSRKLDIENNGNNSSETTGDLTRNEDGEHSNAGSLESETSTSGEVGVTSSNETTSETTHNANGDTWDLYSDTPQGGISGIQGAEDDPALGTNAYLTNARHIIDGSTPHSESGGTSSGESSTTSSDSGTRNDSTTDTGTYGVDVTETRSGTKQDVLHNTEDYLERVTGKTAGTSYSRMLMEFRETFINIDKMVIDALEDLFFGLWDWGNV